MKSPSTLELVQKAQAGDREAFELLVSRYEDRLEALVHLRLGPRLRLRVEPEDVLQEIWKRAFESIGKFVWIDERSVFRWLGGIGEHVILSEARCARTRKRDGARNVPLRDAGEHAFNVENQLVAKDSSPSRGARREERFERLEAALNSLTGDYREVIILAQIRGLSRKEIGERMGRSADAVSMLLLRALRELKKVFGETDSLRLPPRRLDASSGGSIHVPASEKTSGASAP